MEDGSESDDDDFDMDEWWNKVKKGALAASARTGKDVLVEACETSESDEQSEESDDESEEESGEEGPREECEADVGGLTRRDLAVRDQQTKLENSSDECNLAPDKLGSREELGSREVHLHKTFRPVNRKAGTVASSTANLRSLT